MNEKIKQLKKDARDTAKYVNGLVELKDHLDAVNYYINKAIEIQNKYLIQYIEDSKGEYSSEEMRDGYWILENILKHLVPTNRE